MKTLILLILLSGSLFAQDTLKHKGNTLILYPDNTWVKIDSAKPSYRCEGLTKAKEQCKLKTKSDNHLCHLHTK